MKHLYYFEFECPLLDDGLKEFAARQLKKEDERAARGLTSGEDDDRMDATTAGKQSKREKSVSRSGNAGKRGGGKERGKRRSSASLEGETRRKSAKSGPDKKKYLYPISKTCSDRHKLDTDIIGWKLNINRRCFFFQPNTIKWTSDSAPPEITRDRKTDGWPGCGCKEKSRQSGKKCSGTDRSDQQPDGQEDGAEAGKSKGAKDSKNETGKSKTKADKERMAAEKAALKAMLDTMNALLDRDVEMEGATKFKSKEIEWSRVLEFKQPVTIKTTDLLALRDTFRTVLTLRIFHIKVSQYNPP